MTFLGTCLAKQPRVDWSGVDITVNSIYSSYYYFAWFFGFADYELFEVRDCSSFADKA